MKIYYDEIDGNLYPKLLIVPFSADDYTNRVSIDITAPFERMYAEDFHDDFKALTITQTEMLRDHDMETVILIDIELVKRFMKNNSIDESMMPEVEYLVMLLDDVEELLQMDVRRFYLE